VTTVEEVKVRCEPAPDGWRCTVVVGDGPGSTRHEITVSTEDGEDLAAATEVSHVQRLVEETFDFLLEREPKTSILRAFDITVVSRYFPEFEHEIRSRLAP
jgi:hypothetical protein